MAACKLWSIVLTSLVLIMAAGRVGAEVLVWAAAPILLLALADAVYKVQATRIADLAAKETIRAEELFRIQAGNAGFAVSIQKLSGLASFSVWPFYGALSMMLLVMVHTVLQPQSKTLLAHQNSSFNGGPYLPNAPGSFAYAIQQSPSTSPAGVVVNPGNSKFAQPSGEQAFSQPPPNQITVTRPNLPPMGVPPSKSNTPGTTKKVLTVPGGPPPTPGGPNRPAPNTFPPPKPNTQPTPNATQNASTAKPVPTQTPQPK